MVTGFNLRTNPSNKSYRIIREFYTLMQPRKQQILRVIEKSNEPLYITEIAKRIKLPIRTTSFHLQDLQTFGFLTSKFEENKKGRSARYFKVTSKVKQTREKLIKLLSA